MSKVISISEVHKHQDKNSVWMIIHNDVYDVTKFLDEHPGGEEALLDFAGKEATQGFEDVGHSDDARELLKKFKIGTLPEAERNQQAPAAPSTSTSPTWARRSKDQKVRIEPQSSGPVNVVKCARGGNLTVCKLAVQLKESKASDVYVAIQITYFLGSNWKWYVLALLGAIAIGVLIKKKMEA